MSFLKTLYGRLGLVLTGLLLVVGIAFLALSAWTARGSLDALNQDLHRTLAANLVKERLIYVDGEINEEGLELVFHDLMVVNPAIECYLLDLEGRVVRHSGGGAKLAKNAIDVTPIERFLEGGDSGPIRGGDPREPDARRVFSAAPVMVGDAYRGYLYIVLGGQEYTSAFELVAGNTMLRVSLGAAAGVVLFALASGWLLFHLLTRRVRRLARALDAFEQSGFTDASTLPPAGHTPTRDEIDVLGARFRTLAERVAWQVERLRDTDALRLELVANVSHDLRTPLASLRGYLETLALKEGTLGDDERKRYLGIAIRHADRLSRLVEDLFELAKLDARHDTPSLESFSLGELVMDLLQKYELSAEQKSVQLRAQIGSALPAAHAEIGLIERALENLIDNALRHTPHGGSVTVKLAPQGADLLVSVEDTGPGIAPENLPHILDPFFRVPGEGEDAGRGAGLGLAIVRRILELHERTLEVDSRVGEGTSFSFHLAATNA